MKSPSKKMQASSLSVFNKIAKRFGNSLHGGEVIALSGNLGAGKTAWVKALAEHLGVTQVVTSPTFVVMNIYTCTHPTIKQLVHIDAYRLFGGNELVALGALEYFHQPNTLVCIEWPEQVADALTKKTIAITIKIEGKKRIITINQA